MRRWDPNGTNRARFMAGRYGADSLGRFLSIAGCCTIAAALLLRLAGAPGLSAAFGFVSIVLVGFCYFRILSRNADRRSEENRRYLAARDKVTGWFCLKRDCFRQRRDYVFYRCPGCHQVVRVPRGKGRIRITCRRCGYAFERKT